MRFIYNPLNPMPRRYKVKPTPKQAKALQLIRDGIRPTEAMRQAGYAEKSAVAPGQNLLSTAGAQSFLEKYKSEYAHVGITPQFMAAKTQEWLTAQKIDHSHTEPDMMVPDYQTQLKAAQMVREDWGLTKDLNQTNIGNINIFVKRE